MIPICPKIPAMIVTVPFAEDMSMSDPSVLVIRRPSPLESVVNEGGTHDEDEPVTVLNEYNDGVQYVSIPVETWFEGAESVTGLSEGPKTWVYNGFEELSGAVTVTNRLECGLLGSRASTRLFDTVEMCPVAS